jgi:hypothetical protein
LLTFVLLLVLSASAPEGGEKPIDRMGAAHPGTDRGHLRCRCRDLRLPDATSALAVVTPTAVGLVGLLAFVRHFLFHELDAKRLGWESTGSEFQYEVGFANLAFALVAFLAYFGGWAVAAQVAVVLGYGLYLLQAALLHTWQSVYGEGRLRRLVQSALPALAFSLLMIYIAVEAMIQAGLSLR